MTIDRHRSSTDFGTSSVKMVTGAKGVPHPTNEDAKRLVPRAPRQIAYRSQPCCPRHVCVVWTNDQGEECQGKQSLRP